MGSAVEQRIPGELADAIDIEASMPVVWALVGDPRRMAQWSPQVDSVRLRQGSDEVGLGAEFTNRNVDGELAWVTHGRVVRFEPEREIAFRIEENWVTWSFTLEPLASGGTRLHERRVAPEGIAPAALGMADRYLGGQEVFAESMARGVRQTLEAIKAAAETAAA